MSAETPQRVGVQPVRAAGGYKGGGTHARCTGLHARCTGGCTLRLNCRLRSRRKTAFFLAPCLRGRLTLEIGSEAGLIDAFACTGVCAT